MQASGSIIARPQTVQPPAGARLRRGLTAPLERFLREAGAMLLFAGHAFWELRGVWRYFSEVLRQTGILIAGSALVMWGGVFIFSMECGLETEYIFRSFGASSYAG